MRSPGIIALHAVTSANALHFIYGTSGDDTTRRLALLQAVGWIPLYRAVAKPPRPSRDRRPRRRRAEAAGEAAVGEIFETVSDNRSKAAEKVVGYLEKGGPAASSSPRRRRMIFHKGRDSHDYKYGAAAWEECLLASDPKWQRPAGRRPDVPRPRRQDARQPADDPRPRRRRSTCSVRSNRRASTGPEPDSLTLTPIPLKCGKFLCRQDL